MVTTKANKTKESSINDLIIRPSILRRTGLSKYLLKKDHIDSIHDLEATFIYQKSK